MLCPVLTCRTAADLLATHRRLVDDGARLVEWRLDYCQESLDLCALIAARPGPIVCTVRRPEDGGRWPGDEATRRELLRAAINAGCEYVDLEPDAADCIARSGATRRIISRHDFSGTPGNLAVIHAELAAHDADIVKLATMARSTHDAFRMLELVRHSRRPTIGLCMGELGTPTRILALVCGAPLSYVAVDGDMPPAPGQLSFHTLRDDFRGELLNTATTVLGVIGDPIGHSRSPVLHNRWLHQVGLNAVYLPFRVPADELLTFLDDARQFGIRGLSVTIPHKEQILRRVTVADEAVREIGAANTLLFSGADLHAYNTDQWAAIESLRVAVQAHAPASEAGSSFKGRTALVLGAGGAARAIVHGLLRAGANVLVSNRTRSRAEEITFGQAGVLDWDARHESPVDVLVNCTPLGMSPRTEETPYDALALRSAMVVFDTVYNPVETRLLREAATVGCRTITGLEMFVRQGARQFELFTGLPRPDVNDARRALLES